jgi:hypothetical protein
MLGSVGGMLLGRTLSILLTMTIGTSMAARQGPTAMAAHQICLQVWLAVSLLADALAVSAQVCMFSSRSHPPAKICFSKLCWSTILYMQSLQTSRMYYYILRLFQLDDLIMIYQLLQSN